MYRYKWIRIGSPVGMGPVYSVHEQWRSISTFYQWTSEQKDFHSGAAECEPTQGNAWSLVRVFSSSSSRKNPHATTQLVKLHKAQLCAQPMPNSMIPSLLARLLQTDFEISPPQNHTMPQCHANLFLTETPCRPLEKSHTSQNNVEPNGQKNPTNLRAYLPALTPLWGFPVIAQ